MKDLGVEPPGPMDRSSHAEGSNAGADGEDLFAGGGTPYEIPNRPTELPAPPPIVGTDAIRVFLSS